MHDVIRVMVVPIDVLPEAALGPLGLVDDAGVVSVAVLFAYRIARARKALRDSGGRAGQAQSWGAILRGA